MAALPDIETANSLSGDILPIALSDEYKHDSHIGWKRLNETRDIDPDKDAETYSKILSAPDSGNYYLEISNAEPVDGKLIRSPSTPLSR